MEFPLSVVINCNKNIVYKELNIMESNTLDCLYLQLCLTGHQLMLFSVHALVRITSFSEGVNINIHHDLQLFELQNSALNNSHQV